ncbi:MAG: DNA mismatch repair protein MutS [Planctomycetota bacterium]
MCVKTEYERRLAARQAVTAARDRWEGRIANLRFVAAVAFVALLFIPGRPVALVAIPVVAFIGLVIAHERVIRSRDSARRAEAFHERGLARLAETWHGSGTPGERYLDRDHPCAGDLDLFGKGSLFELLCTARTRAGEDDLAARLSGPADPDTVAERQSAVRELTDRLDLREEIALTGDDMPVGVEVAKLEEWGGAPRVLTGAAVPVAAAALAVGSLAAAVVWAAGIATPAWLALAVLVGLAFRAPIRKRVEAVLAAGDRRTKELDLFSRILARFERETFTSARLVRLREEIATDGVPASREIRRLVRLYALIDARRNMFFFPIAWLLGWEIQLAFALERWRARAGKNAAPWLRATGEIEAFLALASYAYERPEDPYPEVVPDGPLFDATAIAHPLLPAAEAVHNDVRLDGDRSLLVVSGSNMSGKTTLLRTIGANLVLAYAGAPVRAERLVASSLQPAAAMRVRDSLLEGRSLFYAEIRRLKLVVDLADGDRPVLFLLDELLSGTNSNDRAAGAEGLVRGLLDRGAIGLVTTHDLALGRIADELAPRAANVHFEDQLTDGRMSFDYTLRDGVVEKSNALELMRAVGLEV